MEGGNRIEEIPGDLKNVRIKRSKEVTYGGLRASSCREVCTHPANGYVNVNLTASPFAGRLQYTW
jgi:hypothetical protein